MAHDLIWSPDLTCLAVFSRVRNVPRHGVRFLTTWQSALPDPLEAAASPVGTVVVSASPESWRCHVAVWEGTHGALLLELGHGTTAAILWAVLQAYMCLGVCNCERESRGRNLPLASLPYKIHEVMLQSSSFSYLDLELCSPPSPSKPLEGVICSARSLFSCGMLIFKSPPCFVTACDGTSCIFIL